MNQDNGSCQRKEIIGRELFEEFVKNNKDYEIVKFSEKTDACWDVAIKHGHKKAIVEIKKRIEKSTKYPNWMMEVKKFKRLTELAKERNVRAYYVNHFTDGVTYVWDVTNLSLDEFKITNELQQKNDYSDEKVWKEVFYLLPNMRINNPIPDFGNKIEEDDEEDDLGF